MPIFADTFDRADTTALTTPWTGLHAPTRRHGISGNAAYHVDGTGETATVVDAATGDVRVTTNITLGATGNVDPGVCLRAVSSSRYLLVGFTLRSGVDRVAAFIHDSTYTLLGEWSPAGLVAGQTYLLEVTLSGDALTVKVNGTTRVSATLTAAQVTTLAGNTRHGLRSSSEAGTSRWLDFDVSAPTTEVNAQLAGAFGGLTATAAAGVDHIATAASDFGGLTATASATVEHGAVLASSFGGLTAAAAATVEHGATLASSFGGLTATALAAPDRAAVLASAFGGLTATMVATPTTTTEVSALLASAFGGLTATATATAEPPVLYAPIVTRRRSLFNDRPPHGLWSRINVPQALALVKVDGAWASHSAVTQQLRDSASRVVGGGHQDEVTLAELGEMVVDGAITEAEYEAAAGRPYAATSTPDPDTDPGGDEDFTDPDDPIDPWLAMALTTESGEPIGTEDGTPIAVEA
jgi:hypothetical protein